MVSYHLIDSYHRYTLHKVFLIHSAETTEVLSHLPVIITGLTFTRCFTFSSPHAAPDRCVLANPVPSQDLAGNQQCTHAPRLFCRSGIFIILHSQLSLQQLPKGRCSWQSILHSQPRESISMYVTTFKCFLLCVRFYLWDWKQITMEIMGEEHLTLHRLESQASPPKVCRGAFYLLGGAQGFKPYSCHLLTLGVISWPHITLLLLSWQ